MFKLLTLSFDDVCAQLPPMVKNPSLFKGDFRYNCYIAVGGEDSNALFSYTDKEIEIIPWESYYLVFHLIETLISSGKCKNIFSYGSLGTKKFKKGSDIDLFIHSNVGSEEILDLILQAHKDCFSGFILDNSIKLFSKNTLLECCCISNIEEATRFLPESPYLIAQKRIFLAENANELAQKLENICLQKQDPKKMLEFLIKSLKYTLWALPKLVSDPARLRFHAFIIEHYILRIRAIQAGDVAHNYSPRYAKDYLSKEEWDLLNFNVYEDPQKYIERINNFSTKIILLSREDDPK
ncbi:MAG: nucleotidyltransferase domain-containing protein [Brevinema sp.]